jgi:putative transposase
MLKAFKYRIYPNKEQRQLLSKHFGCVRFVYNWALDKKNSAYQKENKSLSCFELANELAKLKKQDEYVWLNEVNSQSLQMSIRNLDNAFTKFFREKKGFPNFKKKKTTQSFQCPQHSKVDFENNTLSIVKIPNIKIKLHREFKGDIKTVTISKTSTNKYFASVLVETSDKLPKKPSIKEKTTIGIDLGIKHFATLSNGVKVENPKHLNKSLKKLKKAQRKLSRKEKGSNNRDKARLTVAKLHEKITNQRNDLLHKLTYKLTHDNQVGSIAMEDLNVSGMVKNHHLAQSISDASWSKFVDLLKYKCEWYGKNLIFIGRFEPSSKMCSCGTINNELTLTDREWTCNKCNTKHDRDILASQNIKKFAIQKQNLIGQELSESTLGERQCCKTPQRTKKQRNL